MTQTNTIASIPQSPLPTTRVQMPKLATANTVLLTPADMRAHPEKIASEHKTNAIMYGLAVSALGALLGLSFSRGTANRKATILTTTALGGALGVSLGAFSKTREEAYSKVFADASRDPDFVGHVKREMGRRESWAFVQGALVGIPGVW